jgi:large subunit ribosomal protein L1
MKHGKTFRNAQAGVDRDRALGLPEALQILEAFPKAKFDESVDVAIRLNVNPKYADQMVRGSVVLPAGTGKTVRVLVITRGAKEKEALDAGADMVGADEYLPKIKEGWTDVDVIIATPDIMGELGKFGRILGPRGLMPNPKVGPSRWISPRRSGRPRPVASSIASTRPVSCTRPWASGHSAPGSSRRTFTRSCPN